MTMRISDAPKPKDLSEMCRTALLSAGRSNLDLESGVSEVLTRDAGSLVTHDGGIARYGSLSGRGLS